MSRRPVTGERVTTPAGGFNPTWQRHVAAYGLCAPLLPRGRVVDLGCGTGHSFELLGPRETVGVDLDAPSLQGQNRETVVADMRALPFSDDSFSAAIAVQSLEHVPDPERIVAEAARVVEPEGMAIFVTPNRLTFSVDGEIVDPYHYVELDGTELKQLLRRSFQEVRVLGLFGSPAYMDIYEGERARLRRLLGWDPMRLRRLLPQGLRRSLYDWGLRRTRATATGAEARISPDDFSLRADGLDDALDLVGIAERPRG
ncbi:MAG TPA: class I SAM-dependent methyltransferase [Solirubrobacterales bacterium]|nr:class I SAM-dependent methyltransferase [Solirubrobacterales bacterium]